jgi:hypothetical protein
MGAAASCADGAEPENNPPVIRIYIGKTFYEEICHTATRYERHSACKNGVSIRLAILPKKYRAAACFRMWGTADLIWFIRVFYGYPLNFSSVVTLPSTGSGLSKGGSPQQVNLRGFTPHKA